MPDKKVDFLTRKDLEPLLVTEADAFTQLRYLRHREQVEAIPELEEKGSAQVPGFEGSMCDIYESLWDSEPVVKEEVPADRQYWKNLFSQALVSNAYVEVHAKTQLRDLLSVIGTVSMAESVLSLIPEEDKKKLQDLKEAQDEAQGAGQEADNAQAQADALNKLLAQMNCSGQGKGQSDADADADGDKDGEPNGKGQAKPSSQKSKSSQSSSKGLGQLTKEQAQELANQLASANAKAQQATAKADQAKAEVSAQLDNLLGKAGTQEAEDKMRQLARIGLQAVKDTEAKVEEVSETIEAWGLEEGDLTKESVTESLGLLARMKKNSTLKKFSSLLGKIRRIAAKKARSSHKSKGARILTTETGRDIKRANRAELVALINPSLRAKALQRWSRGELRLFGEKNKEKLGYGPIVVCEDSSGSMDGAKQQWAKAVSLSLAHFAKIQKRSFGWIMFDYSVRLSRAYKKGEITAKQMLEIVESRSGGGTDFEAPLRRAIEMIKTEGLKKADICFITDGECAVSEAFLKEMKAVKKALEINIFTVLCDSGSSADACVAQFSDRIEHASAFSAEEAEKKVFGNL